MATAVKPKTHKRPLSNSTEALLASVMDKAAGPMVLPAHIKVPLKARAFFDDIISARPRAEWSKSKVALAAQCAQVMASVASMADTPLMARQRGALIALQLRLLTALQVIGCHAPRYVQSPDQADDDELLA